MQGAREKCWCDGSLSDQADPVSRGKHSGPRCVLANEAGGWRAASTSRGYTHQIVQRDSLVRCVDPPAALWAESDPSMLKGNDSISARKPTVTLS
jgi:hypothetical protein